jgi:arylsulfatase A-like enzyme
MAQQGYRTGGFIGNWYHIGNESGMGAGFITYDDIGHSIAHVSRGVALVRWSSQQRPIRRLIGLYETLGRRRAPDVSASFLRWASASSDHPWFAFLNYMDAHSPYLPPPPFDAMFGTSVAYREPIVIEELNRNVEPTPERVQAELDAYDGGMAYLDDQIGRLFDELERRGMLDNTIVVITSDHGEELGEHGRWGHAYSLYAEIVHVPLLIVGPGVPAGVRVARPASLRSVPATIAELIGTTAAPFPGISLSGHWRGAEGGDPAFSEFGEYLSLYDDRYHYLVGVFDDQEHLFDHRLDPLELQDLASPAMDSVLAAFRRASFAISPPGAREPDRVAPPPADTGK